MAIARRIDAVRGRVVPACHVAGRVYACRPSRGVEPSRERFRLQVEGCLHQICLHPAALACSLPAHQRGKNAHGEQRCAMMIDHGYPDRPRRCVAGDGHDSEQRLGEQILARALRVGALGAVARCGGVDQSGFALAQGIVAQPQLVHDAGAKILGHDVGALNEPARDVFSLLHLQIEREVTLVPIRAQMQHSLSVMPDIAAAPVALPCPLRTFDRDHVRAEIRQHLDAHGAQQEMIEADDADALQEVEH